MKRSFWQDVLFVTAIIFFGMMLFVHSCVPANAQEIPRQHDLTDPGHWYDAACCNRRDCQPANKGQVTTSPDGFVVRSTDGTKVLAVVPYSSPKIRESKDDRYHPCILPISQAVLCLYVPPFGS